MNVPKPQKRMLINCYDVANKKVLLLDVSESLGRKMLATAMLEMEEVKIPWWKRWIVRIAWLFGWLNFVNPKHLNRFWKGSAK